MSGSRDDYAHTHINDIRYLLVHHHNHHNRHYQYRYHLYDAVVASIICVFSFLVENSYKMRNSNSDESFSGSYNSIIGTTINSLSDFSERSYYDDNNKLSNHMLLFPQSCSHIIDSEILSKLGLRERKHRLIHPVANDAEMVYFSKITSSASITTSGLRRGSNLCNNVFVERGVDGRIRVIMCLLNVV